ncbi:flagellar basal body rod protein FlgG [Bacillus mangrovi]|uniref:Flagellar hook protein FlgE n=1 Tax=Metabacillus mangrovi TaxID=1491830 RepID=A0A7X2S302_9BACI|nr:flagellar basal body rod protein FlgG [Metabacillus mangrovi]MTH52749.1 flagellar basal body rod protein FlgG [Metabacillus mangrovi]
MLRSLYSGISGMKNFQTKLDVIGNNISNVNTHGFKKGRTIFQDLYSQSVSGASAPAAGLGGTNPRQVGLGSQLAAIDTIHTGGSMQTTGRNLDLAISGDGFFQVGESNGGAFTNISYTRAGNFYLDNAGNIVNSSGQYLSAWSTDTVGGGAAKPAPVADPQTGNITSVPGYSKKPLNIPADAKSMSIGQDGAVSYVDENGDLKYAGLIEIAKFPNAGGLEKKGNNLYTQTTNSGAPVTSAAGLSGIGTVQAGSLEMSNVDLSEEFTEMIVAQRGFQSNTKIITTSDEILQELMNLKR